MSRLRQRVRRLESSKGNAQTVVIVVGVDEAVEEVQERHFAEHPEDRDASGILIVQLRDPTKRGRQTASV